MKLFTYTDEHLAWLSVQYQTLSRQPLTQAFNRRFGLDKTPTQIISYLKRKGVSCGRTGQYQNGNVPWTAGTKGTGICKSNSGCFKKGNVPTNINPIGTERIDKKYGYIQVKIDEENPFTGAATRYRNKQIVVWQAHNGPVPASHIITFIDDDKLNCDISNLECISRAEHCRRNKFQLSQQPAAIKPSIKLLAKLITRTHERIEL